MDSLYSPLRRLVNSSTTLTQSFASMDRVFELLDEKYDIVNVPNAVQTKKLNGEIVFDNVSFRYNVDEKEILHNLSLTMQPGEKVALVGASGGGKSSLASLIPRFYDVSEGTVYVDGIDVRKYNMRNLRSHIGIVLQDNLLFSDTIGANILYGN